MGIGCVLLFWAVALAAVAVSVGLLLLWLSRRTGDKERRRRVFRWLCVVLPAGAVYAVVGFAAYWAFCAMRGVDPGIGDSWQVPLTHGYSLSFIDVWEQAFVSPPGSMDMGKQVASVAEVGDSGQYLFGVADGKGFLIDTKTGLVEELQDRAALLVRLKALGIWSPQLRSVKDVYFAERWGWQDVIVLMVLGVPALLVLLLTLRWAWLGSSRHLPEGAGA
jgi:hypothetical protein